MSERTRATVTGSGVARGIAIGHAHLLAPSELEVRQVTIERRDVLHEIARLTRAFAAVRDELDELKLGIAHDAPTEVRAFLDLHRLILDDSLLSEAPRDLIRARLINAEWALTIQLEEVCRQFEAIDDEYLRERSTDVRQVVERVLNALAEGKPGRVALPKKLAAGERLVLVARDLAPADMLHLKDRADVDLAGFVTELGGPTSHTAIMARSLGLPAIVGAARARDVIEEGDLVVIDADADLVVVNPSDDELQEFRRRLRSQAEHRVQLRKLKGKLARTRDGVPIDLLANIELPGDARDALEAGADGIGLFRSEFLFMDRDDLPIGGRAVRGVCEGGARDEGQAGRDPHARHRRRQGAQRSGARDARHGARRAAAGIEPCTRPARNPLLPGVPGSVLDPAARDSACLRGRHRPHPDSDAGACARNRAGGRLRRPRQGAAQGAQAQVRRPHPARRHGGGARGRLVSAGVRATAQVPVDRHQRPDPVHAGDRPHRQRRGPPV